MTNGLVKKLMIPIIAGATAFGGMKANAEIIYQSPTNTITVPLDVGYLQIVESQKIETIDTNNDGFVDTARCILSLESSSGGFVGDGIPHSFYKLNIGADLLGKGYENLSDVTWNGNNLNWTSQTTGPDSCSITTNSVGTTYPVKPGWKTKIIQDFKFDTNLDGIADVEFYGFNNVSASVDAPAGSVPFDYAVLLTSITPAPNGALYGILIDAGLATTNSTPAEFETASEIDSDADAFLDWQEYIAGTVATDSNSFFTVSTTNTTELTWSAASNRTYSVLSSTNLLSGFAPLTNGLTSGTYAPPATNDAAFYKVEVALP